MNSNLDLNPHSIMWTFGACLGIYLVAYGIISLAGSSFQFLGNVFYHFSLDSLLGIFALLPASVKFIVGLLLFQRSKRELVA